jgi:MoaA/NifB/PqqE/SkfB family radical SAM enzyme
MVKIGATFLTEKNYDKNKVKTVLKNYAKIIPKHDESILNSILSDFESDNFSLITPQQVQFLNSNSEDKWAPYLIFRYKFTNYPKNHTDSEIPSHLIVEPISACNLRCVMCFQVDETFSGNQSFMGKMDFQLFKKIIDDATNIGIKAITLTGRGEPTLHPQMGEMLEYCSGKFFELKMNTNATRLSDKLIHQILKSGMTDLVFSVDSYEKTQYESIRVLGIFETVLNNIKKFKEIKEKYYPNSKCATRVSGVKIDEKQDPVLFKKFWEQYVDHVVMVEMQYRWDTYNNPTTNAGVKPCEYLWGEMNIWCDGVCNPCDTDYKSVLAVGSITENNIKDIWNGDKYKKLRQLHKSGQRSTCHPCERCPNW